MNHIRRYVYCNPRETDATIIERNQKAYELKEQQYNVTVTLDENWTSTDFEKQRIKTGRKAPRTNETFLFEFYEVMNSNNLEVSVRDLQCSWTRRNWIQACWWNRSYTLLIFFCLFQLNFEQRRYGEDVRADKTKETESLEAVTKLRLDGKLWLPRGDASIWWFAYYRWANKIHVA